MTAPTDLEAHLRSLLPGGRADGDASRALVDRLLRRVEPGTRALAFDALATVDGTEALTPAQLDVLEGEVLTRLRPAIDVRDDSYAAPGEPWEVLDELWVRDCLEAALPAIGRVTRNGEGVGSGFLAGPDVFVTNRHVATTFAKGAGVEVRLRTGRRADVDFVHEIDRAGDAVPVVAVELIHDRWDVAVLRLGEAPEGVEPLAWSGRTPEELIGTNVAVVGYPGPGGRSPAVTRRAVFRDRFHVKRLQPGKATGRKRYRERARGLRPLTHDASTLPGSSGSPVLDLEDGSVVGVHFAGRYLFANYAVAATDLAEDALFARVGGLR